MTGPIAQPGTFPERLRAARASGEVATLLGAVPFAAFLGIGVDCVDGVIEGTMAFAPHVVGNQSLPAIHGGAIATLLETTAIAAVLWEAEPEVLPRPVTLTFEYLRSARAADVRASATIVRRGRRVCTVRAVAWQEDREKAVATASATLLLV